MQFAKPWTLFLGLYKRVFVIMKNLFHAFPSSEYNIFCSSFTKTLPQALLDFLGMNCKTRILRETISMILGKSVGAPSTVVVLLLLLLPLVGEVLVEESLECCCG